MVKLARALGLKDKPAVSISPSLRERLGAK
jgi:hypothetical protein